MHRAANKGSVLLVVLCFVAVLGIGLASYLALSTQAMKFSNRSARTSYSRQLAELGIEEALRAFNKNDWSSWTNGGITVTWDTSTYAASKRAVASIAFPAGKFGQSVIGSVKIRVDNYNANQLDSTWSSSSDCNINDLVGRTGIWYRCVKSHPASQTPNGVADLQYWVPAPIPWTWDSNTTYSPYDVVNYDGIWYRCHTSCTNITPTNTSRWSSIASISLPWSSGTYYEKGSVTVNSTGTWYYCIDSHTSSAFVTTSNTSKWARMLDSSGAVANPSANTYSLGDSFLVGDYIYRNSDGWYRCVAAQPYTYSSGDYSDTSKWVNSAPYISWAYRAVGSSYSYNKVVYHGAAWYRYINASSSSTAPAIGAYWENALAGPMSAWSNSSINYSLGDTVYYSSRWYRCILAHMSSTSIPPTSTTYWATAPLYSTAWDAGRKYSQYDTAYYNGQWYLSLSSNTATVPAANPGTWALAPSSLASWDSIKYYNLNDTVSYSGTWYRCILANSGQSPTNTTYWSSTSGASYLWSVSTAYSVGSYCCYGRVWYKCTVANTGQSPNNTSYWIATWVNFWGVATGAPVVYAEGTIAITGNPSVKTQLRATIAPAPLFPNAAGAATDLTITTGTGTVDSYDSSVAAYSAGSAGYSAVLAAGGTLAINGTTAVKGYLAWPSPPSGISTGTTVKSSTSPASPNVDTSRVSRSPYVPQFDTLPNGDLSTAWSAVPTGTALPNPSVLGSIVNIGTPGATTPSRYNVNGILQLGSTEAIGTLNINGPVILYISGNLRLRSSGGIKINSTGSAEIHVGGQLVFESGNAGISNGAPSSTNPDPKKVILICHTAGSSVQSYGHPSTPSTLSGVIYMPYTTSATGLAVETGMQIYGALSAKEITFNSEARLHYDTSLRYATFGGVDQPYSVSEWRELPIDEQATMP